MPAKRGAHKVRKTLYLTPYAAQCMEQMMETELFGSETELFEIAILRMYEEFRRGEVIRRDENGEKRATLKDSD